MIGYGFSGAVGKDGAPSNGAAVRGLLRLYVGANLADRKTTMYGITARYRKDRQPFLEDLPELFALLAAHKIHPKIAARLPFLAAREANERIEAGDVDGKIVLLRDVT